MATTKKLTQAELKTELKEELTKKLTSLKYKTEIKDNTIRVLIDPSKDRNTELHTLYKKLETSTKSVFGVKELKETSSLSSAGSFKVYHRSNKAISINIVLKHNGKRGTAIKAVDYLSTRNTYETLDLGKFGKTECYYFDSPDELQKVVIESMDRGSKFNKAQKEVITSLFKEGTNAESGVDSFELESMPNIKNLIVSFGEIYVPWLFLQKKITTVNGLPDFRGTNVVAVAFPKGDLAKIDCIILYKLRNKIKHLYISMKVGTGHEPSIVNFIKSTNKVDWSGVNETLSDIQKYFKTLPSTMGVMKGCCLYYMNKSKCFKKNKPIDVYNEINKAFQNNKKNFTTTELEKFKNWLTNYATMNIDIAFCNNYPFSIPRLIALFIKTECEKKECTQLIAEHVMQGGYFQLRINDSSASNRKLAFTITPIAPSAKATVTFAISNGYGNFGMTNGNHFVGYVVKENP